MPEEDFSSFCVECGLLWGKWKRRETREKVVVMLMGNDVGPDWSWQWRKGADKRLELQFGSRGVVSEFEAGTE